MLRPTTNNLDHYKKTHENTRDDFREEEERIIITKSPQTQTQTQTRILTLVKHTIPEEEIYEVTADGSGSPHQGFLFGCKHAKKKLNESARKMQLHAPLSKRQRWPLACLTVFVLVCMVAMGVSVQFAVKGSNTMRADKLDQVSVCVCVCVCVCVYT
jgi:hypothetical protein